MDTLHKVTDQAKVDRIAKSIEENGWQGAPMVTDGELLLTGVHRYAALCQIDREALVDANTIDIRDICEGYDDQIAEWMEDGDEWYEALVRVLDELDADTQEQYGIDAH